MKNILLVSAVMLFAGFYSAHAEVNNADDVTVSDDVFNANVPAPSKISEIQHSSNKQIQYMLENYTLAQLAQYAVRLNDADIMAAKMSGETPPARLTKETLEDRDKIAEYLRQYYKFSY